MWTTLKLNSLREWGSMRTAEVIILFQSTSNELSTWSIVNKKYIDLLKFIYSIEQWHYILVSLVIIKITANEWNKLWISCLILPSQKAHYRSNLIDFVHITLQFVLYSTFLVEFFR